jgi:DNA-directed RNA polymerase subunit RPC12/RpoP
MDRCSAYGIVCTQCDTSLIAPNWSEYVSKHEVRHSWCCENCGHRILTAVNLRTYVSSRRRPKVSSVSLVA